MKKPSQTWRGTLGYSTPYKFTSKERDEHSGLDYFSLSRRQDERARYYDPSLGVWHGVDKMSSKSPNYSPYVYCGNNPLNRIDRDGNEWTFVINANGQISINLALNFDVSGNCKSNCRL